MIPGEDDNTKEKWTVHGSSTDKGQRKEESPIMAVVEMDHMEADGGMDEVEERGHAVTENLERLMLKIKEVRFTEVLNKIDVAIGMEAGQAENISVPLTDDISTGIIEDKGHNLHVGDKSGKENNDGEIGLIGPHLKSDLLNIKKELPQEDSKWAKPGKESFQLGPTVNKTQKKGTLSRKPKTTKGTDIGNIPHNSVSQISKGKGDTGDFLGEKENGVLAQQTVGRNTWKRTTRISNSSTVMEKGLAVEV